LSRLAYCGKQVRVPRGLPLYCQGVRADAVRVLLTGSCVVRSSLCFKSVHKLGAQALTATKKDPVQYEPQKERCAWLTVNTCLLPAVMTMMMMRMMMMMMMIKGIHCM
jgi:hypothetical protein